MWCTRILFVSILIVIATLSFPMTVSRAFAHRSGCHRWHSCPSDSGSYDCGDWGYANYCSTSSMPTPRIPIITTNDAIEYVSIPPKSTTVKDNNEYVGHTVRVQEGVAGKIKKITAITYTDGVETSRTSPAQAIELNAIDEINKIGTRPIPTAYIDYIWKHDADSFVSKFITRYDIAAAAPKGHYALIKNDKVVALSEASTTGILSFENIKLKTGDKLAVGKYTGKKILWMMPKATSVSEPTVVDIKKLTVSPEYYSLHGIKNPRIDEKKNHKICSDTVKADYLKNRTSSEAKLDAILIKKDTLTLYYPPLPCDIKEL